MKIVLFYILFITCSFASVNDYKLQIGDKVKITIFQEEDLSGEYEVDDYGNINIPLINPVYVANMSVEDIREKLYVKYKEGYLKNPKIAIEITSFLPFSILGEIKKPASYEFKGKIVVLDAVAMAGGFTYRANKKYAYLSNNGKNKKISMNYEIRPGDILIIKERFF